MPALNIEDMKFHPLAEDVVHALYERTQSNNIQYFRVLTAYYFAVVASMMRVSINTKDRGIIPINLYAINLSPSGSGKNYSISIFENEILSDFNEAFTRTFELSAEKNIAQLAIKRSNIKATDPQEELEKLQKQFESLGPYMPSFDAGTVPAVKQMRHKLLLANCGSINNFIDEIGDNLLNSAELISAFLELYDIGITRDKLIKNGKDNQRGEALQGRTPTNTLWFGTPSKLLNGSKTEDEFYSMLEAGYARRALFGFTRESTKNTELSASEVYDLLVNSNASATIDALRQRLSVLADINNSHRLLDIDKDTTITLIEYKLDCERKAEAMPEHEGIRKAEMAHRYFKALKLAGAYAFIDNSLDITKEHLFNSIKLVEESGVSLNNLLNRDRSYVRLAKYIAQSGRKLSQADLVEDLPFYRGSVASKNEMVNLAIAYGYQNNIVIKRFLENNIEFFEGETLEETNIDEVIISYSRDITQSYRSSKAPFKELQKLFTTNGYHWINHRLQNGSEGLGYRSEANIAAGFNLVVIDVDGGIKLDTAQKLLKPYLAVYYTTKRNTEDDNRFRIVFPMNYTLYLDKNKYAEFMRNFVSWLPFEIDSQTFDRARKWGSWNGDFYYNDGELVDILPFIPKTTKNDEYRKDFNKFQSFTHLERWMLKQVDQVGRNNTLLKYAMVLIDAGFDLNEIKQKVFSLNHGFTAPLDNEEIDRTVFVTVARRLQGGM